LPLGEQMFTLPDRLLKTVKKLSLINLFPTTEPGRIYFLKAQKNKWAGF